MSTNGVGGDAPAAGERAGAPAMRGSSAWLKFVGYGLVVVVGLGSVGWVLLHDSGEKKPAAVVAEPAKPKKYNVAPLDTPPPPVVVRPKRATVIGVQPASFVVGAGEVVMTIKGTGLDTATGVAAPGSGILFNNDPPQFAPDGNSFTVRGSVPATAVTGTYRLIVKTGEGDAVSANADADKILLAEPAAPVAPVWIPPLPQRNAPPVAVTPAVAPPGGAEGPGGKPPVDPTLARRLSAPIGSAAGSGGDAAPKTDGEERPASSGVDMGRTKIGVARARRLADMTMMIPAGSQIGCVLDNSIQTDQPGFVSCSVSADVYGADGTVVLIDRGSQIIGEYRNTTITYGKERVFVVWSRVRTPTGVLVEIDSPGTGALGEAGFGGWIDNHYGERIGIPILMSVVTYGIQTVVAAAANSVAGNGDGNGNSTATTGYNNIGQATDQSLQAIMAELAKIKPTLHKNQGDLVNVLVMKDLDMSPAYRLTRTGG